jgi:hypothetical protein
MPEILGFPDTRVNAFMDASVAYMLTATDPVLGDPHDGRRLVQTFSWYSTGAPNDPFNGYLFEGNYPPWSLSSMGENYAALIATESRVIDYYPTALFSEIVAAGNATTVNLQATIANSGNTVRSARAIAVRFYNGDPQAGGVAIGDDQIVSLPGCGYSQTVSVTWPNVSAGTYEVFVETDADGILLESDETNNILSLEVTIPVANTSGTSLSSPIISVK